MKVTFTPRAVEKADVLILPVAKGADLEKVAAKLPKEALKQVQNAANAAEFKGSKGQSVELLAPAGMEVKRLVLLGLGEADKLNEKEVEYAGGRAAAVAMAAKAKDVAVIINVPESAELDEAAFAARFASGMKLRNYRFDRYKTKKAENGENGDNNGNGRERDEKTRIETLTVVTTAAEEAEAAFAPLSALADSVHFARDLVNEPGNVLTPKEFARRVVEMAQEVGLEVDVLKPKQLREERFNALLAVGQGSKNKPRVVVLTYNGAGDDSAPIAFVGKGVCFDSGGISIKPSSGMEDMKGDMGGAAAVVGVMRALAARKAKVNAVGIIGLVENMPDGGAQRPGDIVISRSGQSIAVLNTDAEGRLVLADCLDYVKEKFNPARMIDLATLTGAIIISLGKEHAGLFSNNDDLAEEITKAGLETGERVWRLPLDEAYDKLIDYDIADMKNIGGREAGSITAAQFLQRFVGDVPWAHLDVAGTAMASPKTDINDSWGSGWGVRILNRLVEMAEKG